MKGISPLIAAVLLIAITMTIAGVLAFWASTFVRERVEAWEKEECLRADFQIYKCVSDNLGNFTLTLENLRDVELRNLTVFIRLGDTIYSTQAPADRTLPSSPTLKSFTFKNATVTTWDEVIVYTNCPGIKATTSCK